MANVLNCSTVDVWRTRVFVVGAQLMHYRTVSSILSFYPRVAGSNSPQSCDNQNCLWTWPNVPQRATSSPLGTTVLEADMTRPSGSVSLVCQE